jgi:hypothetical protein
MADELTAVEVKSDIEPTNKLVYTPLDNLNEVLITGLVIKTCYEDLEKAVTQSKIELDNWKARSIRIQANLQKKFDDATIMLNNAKSAGMKSKAELSGAKQTISVNE